MSRFRPAHLRIMRAGALAIVCVAVGAATARAQAAAAAPSKGGHETTAVARPAQHEATPISARYRVTVSTPSQPARRSVGQAWTFHRSASQIALLKGPIDEIWHRDAQGQVSFERVFHAEERAVDYSAGELATLGVTADWTALSSFVDPQLLARLRLVAQRGSGAQHRLVFAGTVNAAAYRIVWRPALQLPERVLRSEPGGRWTEIVLEAFAGAAPAAWPSAGSRSAAYLRLDAADFGDMAYETVVRQSEALDARLGWRTAHHHD